MVTAIGSSIGDAAKAFITPKAQPKVNSLEAIGAHFERNGFSRAIAGDDFNRVIKAVRKAQEQDKGVCFMGACGVGKTLAMKCYFEGIRNGKEWLDCNNEYHLGWLDQPFLEERHIFLDDFGGERMRYGDQDLAGAFIISWHTYHKPGHIMCITTNLDGEKINERYGARVYDRISDLCVICEFSGKTKRDAEVINE